MRLALVKQEVYQDLYVCASDEKNPAKILFSSQGRVGPIGLIADLDADFYIVKEEYTRETQTYRKVIPHIANDLQILKTQTLDKMPGQEFKQPGSPYPNGKFAAAADSIDWSQYDIVISINVSLPTKIIAKYPKTLFSYMIGEANIVSTKALFGYDVTLNQMARGMVDKIHKVVDFPYTFLKGDTLENIMHKSLNRPSPKSGIFMEINSTTERPVTNTPEHFKVLEDKGFKINLHKQKIEDNLTCLYDSKYFVKMGGRVIRGNSVAEAISLGVLAIMDRDECIHHELIIDQCNVKNMEEVVVLIEKLEKENGLYHKLLKAQQAKLTELFFDLPLAAMNDMLLEKRKYPKSATTIKLNNWLEFKKEDLKSLIPCWRAFLTRVL